MNAAPTPKTYLSVQSVLQQSDIRTVHRSSTITLSKFTSFPPEYVTELYRLIFPCLYTGSHIYSLVLKRGDDTSAFR